MTTERSLIEAALPNYEVGVELGRGAFGVVLSGRHRRLDRKVAIKQLPRAFAADPAVRERFVAEARMAAALEHPHIVPVYDYIEQDGLALIVMELCPSTLGDRLRSEGIATDEACAALLATCAALHYAHGRNVLHRDIKPDNLLYSEDGVLKLSDFGIARALDASVRLTQTGMVVGTPAYMAPEQAAGDDVGTYTDVYSAGVVLYELLSGKLPFEDVDSIGALIRQHMFEAPRPLAQTAPGVPPAIAEVVTRALEKEPGDRFPSAMAFGVALAEAAAVAFGPGWLRRRRFALSGATEMVAATEKDVTGSGRAGTVIVRGRPKTELDGPDSPALATAAPRRAVEPPDQAREDRDRPPSPGAPSRAGRRRKAVWVGGVAALAALITVGVLLLSGGGSDAPDDTAAQPPTTGGTAATTPVAGGATPAAPPSGAAALTIASLIDADDPGDEDQAAAIGLAVEDVNAAGGVLGRSVVLVPADYSGDTDLILTLDQLVDDGVNAIVGPSNALDTPAALDVLAPQAALLVSPSDSYLREIRDQALYFSAAPPAQLIGLGAADLVPEDTSSAVIWATANPGNVETEAGTVIKQTLESRGTRVTLIQADQDRDEMAALITENRPEAVLMSATLPSRERYQLMIDWGYGPRDVAVIVINGTGSVAGMDEGALEGVRGIVPGYRADNTLEGRLSGVDLTARAAYAYDAVIIVALASEAAQSTDPVDIAAALPDVTGGGAQCFTFSECLGLMGEGEDFDYEGPGGPYDIDSSGWPTAGIVWISTLGADGLEDESAAVEVTVRRS